MSRAHRPLFLHLSALSDQEYDIYMPALHLFLQNADKDRQITDDVALENSLLSATEVRGWMKGVYSDVTGSVDQILRLFKPGLELTDTLTGCQFLAALRLVMHARSGARVTKELVFVAAKPSSPRTAPCLSTESQTSSCASTSKPHLTDADTQISTITSIILNGDPAERRPLDVAMKIPPSPPIPIPATLASTSIINMTPTPSTSNSNNTMNPFDHLSNSQVSSSTSPSTSSTNALPSSDMPTLPPRNPMVLSNSQSANPETPPIRPSATFSPAASGGTVTSPLDGASAAAASHQSLNAAKAVTSSENAQAALEPTLDRAVGTPHSPGNSSGNPSLSHNHHAGGIGTGYSSDLAANQNQKLHDRGRLDGSSFNSTTIPLRPRRSAPSSPPSATSSAAIVRKVVVAEYDREERDSGKPRSRRSLRITSNESVESDADRQEPPQQEHDQLMNEDSNDDGTLNAGTPKSSAKRRRVGQANLVKDNSGRFRVRPGVQPCSKCTKKNIPCLTTDEPRINKCLNCRSHKLRCDVVVDRLGLKRGRSPGPQGQEDNSATQELAGPPRKRVPPNERGGNPNPEPTRNTTDENAESVVDKTPDAQDVEGMEVDTNEPGHAHNAGRMVPYIPPSIAERIAADIPWPTETPEPGFSPWRIAFPGQEPWLDGTEPGDFLAGELSPVSWTRTENEMFYPFEVQYLPWPEDDDEEDGAWGEPKLYWVPIEYREYLPTLLEFVASVTLRQEQAKWNEKYDAAMKAYRRRKSPKKKPRIYFYRWNDDTMRLWEYFSTVFTAFLDELDVVVDPITRRTPVNFRSKVMHCYMWRDYAGVRSERHSNEAREAFIEATKSMNLQPYAEEILGYESRLD